jgi:hypothetical protein
MSDQEPERLYVLTTDPCMPSKSNLWGTQKVSVLKTRRLVSRKKFSSGIRRLKQVTSVAWRRTAHGRLRDNDFSVEPS